MLPSIYLAEPSKRYEWTVLPQGMKNSPTLCQLYVAWALQPIRLQYPGMIIYHYMDDILFTRAAETTDANLQDITQTLKTKGLIVAPEKVQQSAPWKYLGWIITNSHIRPQKIQLHTSIKTLSDAQKLLGDLQWVRNIVGIMSDDTAPLLPWLRGTDASEQRSITTEQQKALECISERLASAMNRHRDLDLPLSLIVINTDNGPFAVICQWQKKKGESRGRSDNVSIFKWVFLPTQAKFSIQTRSEAIGQVVRRGRDRIREIAGVEPEDISLALRAEDLDWQMDIEAEVNRVSKPIA